jgi:hypothetical protein
LNEPSADSGLLTPGIDSGIELGKLEMELIMACIRGRIF